LKSKRILIGVLNWGLGHATRSIPLIHALINQKYEPVIASDGAAGQLLRRTFPDLEYIELPAYRVHYPSSGFLLPFSLAFQGLGAFRVFHEERRLTGQLIKKYHIDGIISDNRPGIFFPGVPSVYLTHQLRVLSGIFTPFTTRLHRHLFKNFNEIWVPDFENPPYFSGILGHVEKKMNKVKYIGILSRFEYRNEVPDEDIDWLIILSGPEKQRTVLERRIVENYKFFQGKTVLVRGILTSMPIESPPDWKIISFADTLTLSRLIISAKKLILRGGYSSIMDLVALRKKAVLIPTPGQKEQEYLARYLDRKRYFPCIRQRKIHEISRINWDEYALPSMNTKMLLNFKIFA